MRTIVLIAAALLAGTAQATTLVTNANGIQSDDKGAIARFDGFLIGDDGKVAAVLKKGDPRPAATTVVDVGGRTVLPGLIDAHGHVIGLGQSLLSLDLVGTATLDELKSRLKDYAAANPGSSWLVGRGWNQELWPVKAFPTAADLDSVVADRPVWLGRVDGHAGVANSAALRAAGVTAQTAAPAGGRIENGLFVDAAMALVESKIPAPDQAAEDRALAAAQDAMLRVGLTGAADMGTSKADWDALRRAGEGGKLRVRVMAYAAGLEAWRGIFGGQTTTWMYGDKLRLTGTKLYADGALGSRGAYLKAPYHDMPGSRGLSLVSDADLLKQADEIAKNRGQLAIHAIGDAANAQVIGTFETLARRYGAGRRWRIEHLQVADPKDLPRLKRAGIIASMQPTHQVSDRLMAEAAGRRLRLEHGRQARRAARLRQRLPGRKPRPFPRPVGSGQPPGRERPAARRMAAERAGQPRPGASRLYDRRCPCRLCRDSVRRAGAGQVGRFHHRRPRPYRGQPAGAGENDGARDVGGGEARVQRGRDARELRIAGVSTCGSSSGSPWPGSYQR
jgi:predicted amidohydrolase YtcJ